jgi:hypothetical protein
MNIIGTYYIYEMSEYSEDYFNMEVQAYITIKDNLTGEFQFGLMIGYISGEIEDFNGIERFEFTWEGGDENDPASGSGWIVIKNDKEIEGKIRYHNSDSSTFKAKKIEN